MPTYEYECPAGHHFEKFFQRISHRPRAACPTCGKQARRLISGGAGLVFKGSGFYETDYKRAGEKNPVDGGATGGPGGGSEGRGGEGKGEVGGGGEPKATDAPKTKKKDSSRSDK